MKEKSPYIIPITCGIVLLAVILFLLPDSIFRSMGRWNSGNGGSGDDERLAGKGKVEDEARPTETARDLSAELLAAALSSLL